MSDIEAWAQDLEEQARRKFSSNETKFEIAIEETRAVPAVDNTITWDKALEAKLQLDTLMLPEMLPAELERFGAENEDWKVSFGRDGSCDKHGGQALKKRQRVNICAADAEYHLLFKVVEIKGECGGEKRIFLVLQSVLDENRKEITDKFFILLFYNKLKKALGEFLST